MLQGGDFTDSATWQALIAAGVGAAAWYRERQRRRQAEQADRAELKSIAADAKTAAKESQINGGASHKDHTLRVERAVARIERSVQRIGLDMIRVRQTLNLVGTHQELAIFWTDREGRNVDVNHYYADRLGVGRDDLLDNNWQEYVYEADRDDYIAAFRRSLQLGSRFRHPCRIVGVHGIILALAWSEPVWVSQDQDELGPDQVSRYRHGETQTVDQYIGGWVEVSLEEFNRERDRFSLPRVPE